MLYSDADAFVTLAMRRVTDNKEYYEYHMMDYRVGRCAPSQTR